MTTKEEQLDRIWSIIEDNDWRYHVLGHYGLVNDWAHAYNDLMIAVINYLGTPE